MQAQNDTPQTKTHYSARRTLYRGVSWHRLAGAWEARLTVDHVQFYLGLFDDDVDAAQAYDEAARTLLDEHAKPNFRELGDYARAKEYAQAARRAQTRPANAPEPQPLTPLDYALETVRRQMYANAEGLTQ